MLVKSVTEVARFFPECFLFGVNTKRAADTRCSSVVPRLHTWGCSMPSGSHSHPGRCHTTAQFSSALASLQPLGRALQGSETTLPRFPCLLSPLPVMVRQSPLISSSVARSTFWREAVRRFCREGEYLVKPAAFLWFGSRALKFVLSGELLKEKARVRAV